MEKPTEISMSMLSYPPANPDCPFSRTEYLGFLMEQAGADWYGMETRETIENNLAIEVTTEPDDPVPKNHYLEFVELYAKHTNRILYFGHTHSLESFVEPGQLTTRHDIHIGFLNELFNHIKHIYQGDLLYVLRHKLGCIIRYYDMVIMPDATRLIENIEKGFGKYPPPPPPANQQLLAKGSQYDMTSLYKYLKKLLAQIDKEWQWVIKDTVPLPKTLVAKKPFLRVIHFTKTKKQIVFADEVRYAVSRLKKKPNEVKEHHTASYHFFYFPFHMLNHALGLFGLTLNDVQLVHVTIFQYNPYTSIQLVGPFTSNVLRADNQFLRLLGILKGHRNPSALHRKMLRGYSKYLPTGYPLPYFVSADTPDNINNPKMTDYTTSPRYAKKNRKKEEPVDLVPRKFEITNDKYTELSGMVPRNCQFIAIKTLWEYPQYALLLHEHGWCEPGKFCFAENFQVEEPFAACHITEENLKKRIEFVMKYEFRQPGPLYLFRTKIDHEYRVNPRTAEQQVDRHHSEAKSAGKQQPKIVVQQKKPVIAQQEQGTSQQQKLPETETDYSAKTPRNSPRKASDESPPSTSSESTPNTRRESDSGNVSPASTRDPSNETAPAAAESKEDGTENGENESVSSMITNQTTDSQSPAEKVKSEYERLIKFLEAEHQEQIRKLIKSQESEKAKMENDKKTLDKQKTEIKELKQNLEVLGKERKEETDRLSGDLKRVSAELRKMEDEFENLKTKKAIENPERSQAKILKLEEKIKRMTDSTNSAMKQKNDELLKSQKQLQKLEDANRILQSQNDALVAATLLQDREKVTIEELKTKHSEELERVQKTLEEAEAKNKEEYVRHELERMKKQSDREDVLVATMKGLKFELTELQDYYDVLMNHADPSTSAAVTKIQLIKKNLIRCRSDERRYKYAEVQLEEYAKMEKDTYLVEQARSHLSLAQGERLRYEMTLVNRIAVIRDNISDFFAIPHCHYDSAKSYPQPFTTATWQRIRDLERQRDARTAPLTPRRYLPRH